MKTRKIKKEAESQERLKNIRRKLRDSFTEQIEELQRRIDEQIEEVREKLDAQIEEQIEDLRKEESDIEEWDSLPEEGSDDYKQIGKFSVGSSEMFFSGRPAGMFAKMKSQEEKKPMQRSKIFLDVKNYVAKINQNMHYDLNSFKFQYELISRLPMLLEDKSASSRSVIEMINNIRKSYSDSNADLLIHYVESSTASEALREFSGIFEAISKMKIELGQLRDCLGEKGEIISPAIEKIDAILKLLEQIGMSLKNYYSTPDSTVEDKAVSDNFLKFSSSAHKPSVGLSNPG